MKCMVEFTPIIVFPWPPFHRRIDYSMIIYMYMYTHPIADNFPIVARRWQTITCTNTPHHSTYTHTHTVHTHTHTHTHTHSTHTHPHTLMYVYTWFHSQNPRSFQPTKFNPKPSLFSCALRRSGRKPEDEANTHTQMDGWGQPKWLLPPWSIGPGPLCATRRLGPALDKLLKLGQVLAGALRVLPRIKWRPSGWAWFGRSLWPHQLFWLPHQRNRPMEGMGGRYAESAWGEHWHWLCHHCGFSAKTTHKTRYPFYSWVRWWGKMVADVLFFFPSNTHTHTHTCMHAHTLTHMYHFIFFVWQPTSFLLWWKLP